MSVDGRILSVDISQEQMHDFQVFKNSKAYKKLISAQMLVDLGYQGIDKICPNATIPNKRKKSKTLTKEAKQENRKQSSKRIIVEQINAKIKSV